MKKSELRNIIREEVAKATSKQPINEGLMDSFFAMVLNLLWAGKKKQVIDTIAKKYNLSDEEHESLADRINRVERETVELEKFIKNVWYWFAERQSRTTKKLFILRYRSPVLYIQLPMHWHPRHYQGRGLRVNQGNGDDLRGYARQSNQQEFVLTV